MSNQSDSQPETSEKLPKFPDNFDLSAEFAKFLQSQMVPAPQLVLSNPTISDNLVLKVKLNSGNYSLWCNLMRRAILGKGRSTHITGVPPTSLPTDENYTKWEQDDQLVFTWLIDNMDESLVNNASSYPTAKALWDGLAITYGSGADPLQIFDLHKQAYTLKQGTNSLDAC